MVLFCYALKTVLVQKYKTHYDLTGDLGHLGSETNAYISANCFKYIIIHKPGTRGQERYATDELVSE